MSETTLTCPGCKSELTIKSAEAYMYQGLPLECVACGESLGTIGPEIESAIGY